MAIQHISGIDRLQRSKHGLAVARYDLDRTGAVDKEGQEVRFLPRQAVSGKVFRGHHITTYHG